MRYIRSENLKYKRSFSRKLIFVVPIITAFVAVIFGGIRNFQAQTIYWWYTFLLPGTVAIYCSLSEKKEKSVRYHTFYTLSIDLENAWYARVLVIAWYMLLTGIILVLPAVSMKIWAPAICQISNGKLLLGSICIVVMSLWQIPILLFFNKRIGILLPLIINCMLPLAISPLSNTDLWFLIPYSWVSKSMKSIIGLDVNGTMTTVSSTSAFFPLAISIAVSLGINLEEEGHFQALFVGMESKSKLIIAKLILFLGIGAVAIVILFLPILFSVAVMDQELSISVLNTVLYSYVYLVLGNIVTYIIHFWLSLKSGLGASVITGVLESLIVILFSNLPLKLVISWEYIPWAWAVNMCRQEILQFNTQLSTLQPNIIFKVIIITFVLLLVFCIWFEKWEGRKNYEE